MHIFTKPSEKSFPRLEPGVVPGCPVAPDSLAGIPRQQTNPCLWQGDGWDAFIEELRGQKIPVDEQRTNRSHYVTDAGGIAFGLPHGVLVARSTEMVAAVMTATQKHKVPVTVRGGGLTTEGESISFGGLQLDMRGMSRVLAVDKNALTVRCEAGIYWHSLAESLRRQGLDYFSAPLNLTSSVGGTLGVGGIDVNSPLHGCSADQALELKIVTPTGDIIVCSAKENAWWFNRVLLGYGQFGIITEAVLKVRPYTPVRMHYVYYGNLRTALEDLVMVVEAGCADYTGILTMLDRAINLLVAFDSEEREAEFLRTWKPKLRGFGEAGFAAMTALHYGLRPWRYKEALYLLNRKRTLLPALTPPHHLKDGKLLDRTVVFSRAVWKFWGQGRMVIPDLATSKGKFIEAVLRGNAVCRKYFPHYTLYCVGIKLVGPKERYELSCIPADAEGFAYGCEFEPLLEDDPYSRDHLQSFKNAIYDIGVDLGTSYYRFGGMMKGYIRRVFGDALVDRHLAMKRKIDPAMVLNRDVIF